MRKALAILSLAICSSAQAQTFITVTADTNRAIRTNFSLVRSQVSDLSGASFAISNITGLQSDLDGKLATNGDAIALTNFPASLLRTNGNAIALTNFPLNLLRTNGNAAALTNFPTLNQSTTGTASNVTGVVEITNGGTGATNASEARVALELGSAATNDAIAFQPASTNLTALASGDGSSLTNVTVTDAGTLTNFPSELLRTNGDAASLTNFPSELLRTNGDGSGLSNVSVDLTTVLPAYSNNAGLVLAVTTNETGVEWIAVSNTVTDASTLTNFPASLLTTNGDAAGLTNFPSELLRTNGDGSGLTNLPFVGGASATNVGPIMAFFNNTITNTGTGGTIISVANGIGVQASVTNNSFAAQSALMTPGLFVGENTPLNFTNAFSFGAHLGVSATNNAQANFRFYVGTAPNYTINDPTNVVIGWRIKDQTIHAAVHNGTSYFEPFSTNGIFDPVATSYAWAWVEGDGTGSVSWYINGELLGTITNGPTTSAWGRYATISSHNDTGSNTASISPLRLVNFIYNFK